jgi:menaquinone-specific isochorismate synthase
LEYKNFSAPNLFFNTNFDLNHYDPFIPPWASYEEFPEHDQWTEMINACNTLFAKGDLEKIVMSRKKIYGYSEPLEAISFFKSLLEKNPPTTYQIFNQTSFGKAFLSLTPERLFSIDHKQFESISLAGSAPRGKTPEEDAQFEQELKASDKLTREHNIVTNEIVKKLTPLSRELNVSPLETMKLPYIQHRAAPIRALLNEETDALTLVSLLHPTPAVGGLPWDKAKTKILELEPYKRDEYAAPIGIIGARYSELAVGIRSALIEGEVLTIFGGAGIVAGSVPEDEWNETGTKMNPFLKVVHNE